ncbi:polar amino acid transport system permease protein [Robbsia andropogonis]|nr:amino acid ABC transporter permease [Robbsia andropogonis]
MAMDLAAMQHAFFNGAIAKTVLPDIFKGMIVTLELGIAVIVTGLSGGLVLALIRSLRLRWLDVLIIGYADILRALPPLIVIMMLFYAFPSIGLSFSAFQSTWFALALVLAAFAEELFWAGIISVPKGQAEAARSTGMSWIKTMQLVILPQAIRLVMAPLTNRAISTTKNTALGSVVALNEILNNAQSASSNLGSATPLTMGALGYLIIFIPLVLFGRWLEKRFTWQV